MNFSIFFIGCLIVGLPRDVESSELIEDLRSALSPRTSKSTARQREILQSLDDDYIVTDTMGLMEQYGYPTEEHMVTTEDGYSLKIFRIPGSPTSPPAEGKPVVFIQHGLLTSSDSWVFFGPDYDLAFLLADDEYDVWLGNVRGNSYGKLHVNLTTDDKEFWNYSYHDIAVRDLPKMIDYVLERSGQSDLIYIGHSMGTTVSYVLLSEMPEYNEKMRLVVSLGPVALWKDRLNMVIRIIVLFTDVQMALLDFIGSYEFFPQSEYNIARGICSRDSIAQFLCILLASVLFGRDPEDFNYDLVPYIGLYNPAGISTKTFFHFEQNLRAGLFRQYDYGHRDNVKLYGTKEPPTYDLTKITAPYALIYGKSDALAKETNVLELAKVLSNVTVEEVPYATFNHLDFLWATDAKYLLYDRLRSLVSEYSK